jgi:hypothetical protein
MNPLEWRTILSDADQFDMTDKREDLEQQLSHRADLKEYIGIVRRRIVSKLTNDYTCKKLISLILQEKRTPLFRMTKQIEGSTVSNIHVADAILLRLVAHDILSSTPSILKRNATSTPPESDESTFDPFENNDKQMTHFLFSQEASSSRSATTDDDTQLTSDEETLKRWGITPKFLEEDIEEEQSPTTPFTT